MTPGTAATAARVLRRLVVLRCLTMIGYSTSYVVIPTLVFERTRSVAAAGVALVAEGALRAVLALAAGRLRGVVGPRNVVHAAEALKLAALVLLAFCTRQFSLAAVVCASVLYQLGYSLSLLEQELRCAALGPHAARGQAGYRMAEMMAVPPVLLIALASQALGIGLESLVAAAAVVSALHHLSWHRWMRPMPAARVLGLEALGEAARYMAADRKMAGGLVASFIGYAVFSWLLLATPFVFDGRVLMSLSMSSAGGNALFKGFASAACFACALVWARVFSHRLGDRIMVAASVATPLVFLLALRLQQDALAVLAGCAAVALSTGVASWQRTWRLRHAPERLRVGVTTLYLGVECLGMTMAGLALLSGAPVIACLAATAGMAWCLRRFWVSTPSPGPADEARLGPVSDREAAAVDLPAPGAAATTAARAEIGEPAVGEPA